MQNGSPRGYQYQNGPAMNGYGGFAPRTSSNAYSQQRPPPVQSQSLPHLQNAVRAPDGNYGAQSSSNQTPPVDTLLGGYSANASHGMNGTNTGNVGHRPKTPRLSEQLDVSDTVAMHLLVETALGDSAAYHILSVDELERLKKELTSVTPRIEGVRRKLALENKVRDAAISLNRLYVQGTGGKEKRKSGGASGHKGERDSISKTEQEVAQSTQKCADLTRDLYALETRQREIQTRLLMHTAGVLQMTHRGPTEKRKLSDFNRLPSSVLNDVNGKRPDSPESIYRYENGRAVHQNGKHDDFDERSLYRTPDDMYGFSFDGTSKTEKKERSAVSEKDFMELGSRLEDLNSRLREAILHANAAQPLSPPEPRGRDEPASFATLNRQAKNAELNIEALGKAQQTQKEEQQQLEYALEQQRQQMNKASAVDANVLPRLHQTNKQLYGLLNTVATSGFKRRDTPPPPSSAGKDANAEIQYTDVVVSAVSSVIREMLDFAAGARNRSEREAQDRGKAEQYETTLNGLWSIMQASEDESGRGNRYGAQTSRSLAAGNEPFDLSVFNKRVQALATQNRELHDQLSKTAATHTTAREELLDQIESLKLSKTEELAAAQTQRRAVERELETHRRGGVDRTAELERKLADHAAELATANAALQLSRDNTAERQNTLQQLRQQLSEKDAEIKRAGAAGLAGQQEVERLETDLVRLTTELTMAKAELDAAYGSRAERQKDGGGAEAKRQLEEAQARIAELERAAAAAGAAAAAVGGGNSKRERELEDELRSTLSDFEELTRASVESEKERDKLEAAVDALREKAEECEAALSEERVKWLGVKSPGAGGAEGGEMTSMATMRNEFKKMMRETRLEGVKALRAEQEKSRQLEGQLRQLRKDQTGEKKSGLRQVLSAR